MRVTHFDTSSPLGRPGARRRQRQRVFADTEATAKRELRRLLRTVDDGRPIAAGNLTLGALLDDWEGKVLAGREVSGSTRTLHRWALRILRADLGDAKVRSLTPDRVENALQARADSGLSRGSLDKIWGTLSRCSLGLSDEMGSHATSPRSSNVQPRPDWPSRAAR